MPACGLCKMPCVRKLAKCCLTVCQNLKMPLSSRFAALPVKFKGGKTCGMIKITAKRCLVCQSAVFGADVVCILTCTVATWITACGVVTILFGYCILVGIVVATWITACGVVTFSLT